MIKIEVPGREAFKLEYIVLDYNGTLAVDGELLPGVKSTLKALAEEIEVHVITADTFGKVRKRLEDVRCTISILPPESQDKGKLDYVRSLGAQHTVAIGNGRNDRLMLKEAVLGIAVVLGEGCAVETLCSADVVCTDILSALELLMNPLRIAATLRN
jgi:soluble P-type ATPase